MTADKPSDLPPLLAALRRGDRDAWSEILRRFEPWLRFLARLQFQTRLKRKLDPTDVVQQTLLAAHQAFPAFRGTSEAELAAWLRGILANVLAKEVRKYAGTLLRDLDREVSLEESLGDSLEQSSRRLAGIVRAPGPSPSEQAARQEESLLLAEMLDRLPGDYRDVITFRHLDGLSHAEIAKRMGRSEGATRMLWLRALARLRDEMGTQE